MIRSLRSNRFPAMPRTQSALVLVAILATALVAQGGDTSKQETVEEVVALVDRTPILISDIQLLGLVGLCAPVQAEETTAQYLSRALDTRIRLELQYRDLVASGSIHRLTIDLGDEVEALVARGHGRETLDAALAEHGLGWEDLEALALRTAATRAWVDQHLRPRVSVSIEDVESAYRSLVVEPHRQQGDEPPPLAQVEDELQAIVVERELNREIDRWLLQARERLEVLRFLP